MKDEKGKMKDMLPPYSEQTFDDALSLLKELIATPRVSRQEQEAADVLERYMTVWGLQPYREGNNLWAVQPDMVPGRTTLLLNAHIDTVKAVASWTRNPHDPVIEGDRLYGLGSNDCGGGLVTLLTVFRILTAQKVIHPKTNHSPLLGRGVGGEAPYNLVFLASAEEEVSGENGIRCALPALNAQFATLNSQHTTFNAQPQLAIVGEPTGMLPAIAEKGLMVIDGYAHGVSGHAAREEGVNAIYEALDDLLWLRDYRFERISPLLGPTKMSVTVVEAGTQHNVVPDQLHFVIDVRTNELYQNEEVLALLQRHMKHCELKARSTRLHSSNIPMDHPLVQGCIAMGRQPFGSPTLSDQALMPFPSLKLGPGQSSRSHSADEYICLSELREAIEIYLKLLTAPN